MDQNDRDKKAIKEKKKSTKTDYLKMSFDEKRKKMKLMIKKHFFLSFKDSTVNIFLLPDLSFGLQ